MLVSAPGKLMLSGEWAVLEVGNPCIVAAVHKRVFAEIETSDRIAVFVKDFNIDIAADFDGKSLKWQRDVTDKEKEILIFIKGAIETTLQYLGAYKPFKITTWGEESQIMVDGQQKKVGFGSSAAAVVATVAGILAFNGIDIAKRESKDSIYKLATIAHYFAQGKVGSAFDVAASTYGGATVYKRFDPMWLTEQLSAGKSVSETVGSEWPGFYVEELQVPQDFKLVVGWTRESASTSAMVKQMDSFKTGSPQEYKRIYDNIANLVNELIAAWKRGDNARALQLISKNEEHLRELGQKSGVNIETPDLKKLADAANAQGAAGKLSGAGGGDCGIAICFSPAIAESVRKAWQNTGIVPLDATVDRDGVKQSEQIVLVNSNDRAIGYEEKIKAHENGGKLHRAFSIFVFNSKGQMLLQLRSVKKHHFGGLWSNTCCSHEIKGESLGQATHRELMEEFGFDTDLKEAFVFEYRAPDKKSGLTEYEVDHVFIGRFDGEPKTNPDEVDDWKWIETDELKTDVHAHPEKYTPWFKICFERVLEKL